MDLYILDDNGNPVKLPRHEVGSPEWVASLQQWGAAYESGQRQLADDTIGGRLRVSTIFLGMDHGFGFGAERDDYKPVLWETMVFHTKTTPTEPFHKDWNDLQWRYTSRDAALKGHRRAIALAERALQESDAKAEKGAK